LQIDVATDFRCDECGNVEHDGQRLDGRRAGHSRRSRPARNRAFCPSCVEREFEGSIPRDFTF